ncbi:MAG TPA: 8-amino-7-oxononanoate synthase [Opitutae bacterium]|nr:8-amino-7-oxononanoate synthase [Opitutae bacterium]
MIPFLRKKPKNTIRERCEKDEATRMRLRYNPYYRSFDKQEGAHVWLDGKEMILLASNDYLGLGDHPKVVAAGQQALKTWGASTTGARLANGSRAYHEALEEALADFVGREACQISAAGYLSCMSAVESFAEKGDLILVDKNVHSSLWAGIGLTRARVERFAHNNPRDLAEILSYESPETPKMLVLEGVYSMEGHIVHLKEILEVIEGHNCFVVLDDAHGFGVLGDGGRGTLFHLGVSDEVDILTGSFSKALSSTGGFVAGSRSAIEYLRTHSKQTIFSAALSPSQAACAHAALNLIKEEPEHLKKLWYNVNAYNKILKDLGLDTWGSETPAIPIVLGSKERVYHFWQSLLERGVFSVMSIAPAVPPGKDLIRTAISARHSKEDLEKIAEAMAYAIKRS